MLIAQAKGFLGSTYELLERETVVGRLKVSGWRERAELEITQDGFSSSYRFQREGSISGAFLLLEAERVIAFAEKPSAFRDIFEVTYSGEHLVLKRPSFWKQKFDLESNGRVVGSITPKGFLRRRITIDLPDEYPIIFKVFVFWLALIVWRRQQAAAAAS